MLFGIHLAVSVAYAQNQLPSGEWVITKPQASTASVTKSTYGVELSYDLNNTIAHAGQTWEFSTTASSNEVIYYSWDYTGLHAWYDVTATVTAFVEHNEERTLSQLFNREDQGGHFQGAGVSSFNVTNGDKYGFIIYGKNFDYNSFLRGTLKIGTAPLVQPTLNGTLGSDGWYTSDINLGWTVTDPASGEVTTAGCSPITVASDTPSEGSTYTCTASSSGGMSSSSVIVKRDATAPTTSDNAPASVSDSSVTVDLTANDASSGVAATHYIVNGGAEQTGTSVTFMLDGTHTLTYWSVDAAGNAETPKTATITVDKLLPDVLFSADTVNPTKQNVTVSIAYPEIAAIKQISTDSETWTAYEAPYIATDNQTIYARYADNGGTWSEVQSYVIANIDRDPPAAPIITLSTTAPAHEVTVTIDYPEDSVSQEYQLWGDHRSTYSGPFVLTQNRTISAYTMDEAGNANESVISIVNLDMTPPVITIAPYDGATPTNQPITVTASTNEGTLNAHSHTFADNGTFTFIATDLAGNVTTKDVTISNIDIIPPVITIAPYDGSTSTQQAITVYASTNEGTLNAESHTFTENGNFTFRAIDEAGNITEEVVTIAAIDTIAPVTSATQTTDGTTNHVTLELSVHDQGIGDVTTYYTLDGIQHTGSRLVLNKQGSHLITYWSVDAAGNIEPPSSLEVQVNVLALDAQGKIGLDEIVKLVQHGSLYQQDMNGDQVFDREDIRIMLSYMRPGTMN